MIPKRWMGWRVAGAYDFLRRRSFSSSPTPCDGGHYSFLSILLSSACRRENLETTPPAGKVSHDPASLYSMQLPPLSLACLLCPLFSILVAFFFRSRGFFSFVRAPSYHPALAWSPRLRNILSSVVPLAYNFISDTFTSSNARRKNEIILSFQHVSCIFLVFFYIPSNIFYSKLTTLQMWHYKRIWGLLNKIFGKK